MARSCVSSSLRFNYSSLSFSTLKLALPLQPICAWKLRKSNPQESSVKAVYTPECYASDYSPRQGIWSIRDDLQVLYFPAYAQGGQGPPPMVYERFMSVISELFQHISKIISRFGRKGYKLVAIKILIPSKDFAQKYYHDMKERPFFDGLCDFLSS